MRAKLARLTALLEPGRPTLFNVHNPPFDTGTDRAYELTPDMRIKTAGGEPTLAPVGSVAVREAVEEVQPTLALHGAHPRVAGDELGRPHEGLQSGIRLHGGCAAGRDRLARRRQGEVAQVRDRVKVIQARAARRRPGTARRQRLPEPDREQAHERLGVADARQVREVLRDRAAGAQHEPVDGEMHLPLENGRVGIERVDRDVRTPSSRTRSHAPGSRNGCSK